MSTRVLEVMDINSGEIPMKISLFALKQFCMCEKHLAVNGMRHGSFD